MRLLLNTFQRHSAKVLIIFKTSYRYNSESFTGDKAIMLCKEQFTIIVFIPVLNTNF